MLLGKHTLPSQEGSFFIDFPVLAAEIETLGGMGMFWSWVSENQIWQHVDAK